MQEKATLPGPIELTRRLSLLLLGAGTGLYWIVQAAVALDFTLYTEQIAAQTYLSEPLVHVINLQVAAVLILAVIALIVTLAWVAAGRTPRKKPIVICSLVFVGFCALSAIAAEKLLTLYVSSI